MEKMVEEILSEIFKSYPDYDDCKPYKEEIIALALTKCEPYYTTSDVGHAVVKTKMGSSGFRSKVTFHASSSAGTQAGLVTGQAISGWQGQIIGISVDAPKADLEKNVYNLAQSAGDFLNVHVARDLVIADDRYVGSGYGKQTDQAEEAIELFARREGVLLDHVYTGKAAAGLIDYCRSGKVASEETIVFLHTGGNIQLFE